jgi:Tol biopolymer transport system component/DNA-binding winged helix-turn-helix (wHTH) protein
MTKNSEITPVKPMNVGETGEKPLRYQFDGFILDAERRALYRDAERLHLTSKPLETLLYLVEQRGRTVGKQELLDAVWKGTFVTEDNLVHAVREIRRALVDDKENPRFIQTVPREGYRFVASIEEKQDGDAELKAPEQFEPGAADASMPVPQSQSQPARHFIRSAIFLTLALTVVVLVGLTARRLGSDSPASGLRIIPVTSFQGAEFQPALSPEGTQVAFVWDQGKEDHGDIWVKLVDAGTPLQLTKGPAHDTNPAWSPDGRYVAFIRQFAESDGVYLIPALGGPEVKLGEAYPKDDCRSLDWSPEGKFLAVTDRNEDRNEPWEPSSIYLISKETGERRRLTTPPARSRGDGGLAFSPDGKTLAFTRTAATGSDEIYLAPVGGGEAKRLTSDNRWIRGLAWTADGRELVFSSNRGRTFGLWSIPVSGGAPQPFVTVGQDAFYPAIARGQNHLAYVQVSQDSNLWRMEVASSTGRGNPPTQLVASTQLDSSPHYSPDGRKIVFSSKRSGSSEIWVCNNDGSAPVQLTSFGGAGVGTPRWSPDGLCIAFDSTQAGQTEIYVINAEGGLPQRLTEDAAEDIRPSWSRDGRWIYFGSNRSGDWQVWKLPVKGGQAVQVTRQGGREAIESPDGKFVYYFKSGDGSYGIWRVPVAGGEEARVLDQVWQGNWALLDQGIYFAQPQTKSGTAIQFFSFATRQVTQVAVLEKSLIQGPPAFAVSPDGRWILYAQLDQGDSDVMLVENFR